MTEEPELREEDRGGGGAKTLSSFISQAGQKLGPSPHFGANLGGRKGVALHPNHRARGQRQSSLQRQKYFSLLAVTKLTSLQCDMSRLVRPLDKHTAQRGPGCTATKCPAPCPAQPRGLLSPACLCYPLLPTLPPLSTIIVSRGTVPTPVLLSFLGLLVENFTAATKPGCQQASRGMGQSLLYPAACLPSSHLLRQKRKPRWQFYICSVTNQTLKLARDYTLNRTFKRSLFHPEPNLNIDT